MCCRRSSRSMVIQNSNVYKGYFHILGEQYHLLDKERRFINQFFSRKSKKEKIEEVILATSATVGSNTHIIFKIV